MDATQWPQELGLMKPMEDLVSSTTPTLMEAINNTSNICTTTTITPQAMAAERRARPSKEQALNCPRCSSTNTKFCYYNNYSLTQPRYFCKTCRRYWTEGGTLRNVPVGGGSRKKRPHHSTAAAAANNNTSSATTNSTSSMVATIDTAKKLPQHDLNLAFAQSAMPEFNDISRNGGSDGNPISGHLSATELLRSRAFAPMQIQMQMPIHEFHQPMTFGMQQLRPTVSPIGFALDGIGGAAATNYVNLLDRNNGRLLFPFEQSKPAIIAETNSNNSAHFEHNRGQAHDQQDNHGYWHGMISGEGSW